MHSRKHILMTGITGFIGSYLAASFLKQSNPPHIYYLTQDDMDGSKARQAVEFGLEDDSFEIDWESSLTPLICSDFNHSAELSKVLSELEVDEVWHIAAQMSYDYNELPQTVQFNAVTSTHLLNALKHCSRFYFFSSTGVAGLGEGGQHEVPEQLLHQFDVVNPYTLSKILAEYMLSDAASKRGIPLTIIRPGSVIGSSKTGWAGRSRYGYYSYLYPLKKFQNKEMVFYVDIDPDKRFPVIHADHLVELCERLRQREQKTACEIVHAVNEGLWTAREHFRLLEETLNSKLSIDFGAGHEGFNKVYNRMNADNNKFMGVTCTFSMKRLTEALGKGQLPPALSAESLRNVFTGYFKP
ncbi:SDR family oxidoreductase [Paenibacillus sp. KS-LC4]|uniref:NAD-dependent epimerase/dehydratase family protein n=1 Tax=Paenibacillus sp. KS-LC4 TaxID=2979727 RepID=UPI0030D0E1F9